MAGRTAAGFDPRHYDQIPVVELLRAASLGWVAADRRLLQSIIRRDSAPAEILAFSRERRDHDRIGLDLVLADLFHYFRTPEALDFFLDLIRREPTEIDDSVAEAVLAFGAAAVEPLLRLYYELEEEQGSDVAFLLAGLRVRDPRVLNLLLDRLEFDAADGAFCLGLYGDPAARPALQKMLAEIPVQDQQLRREFTYALEQLDQPEPAYDLRPFDILAEYRAHELPEFDVLPDSERIQMFASADAEIRAAAAYSFFNVELQPDARAALLQLAQSDPEPAVRGRAWESLADVAADTAIRGKMVAILRDPSLPIEERGGAAVGLYGVADEPEVRPYIEALYEEGGAARAKALEAMWRSIYKPFAKYFPPNLASDDLAILRQALRGAGYFRLTSGIEKIASYLNHEDLREEALFAYAMAMPGETTRGRARGMLRKIDSLTQLTRPEIRLVMFAIDERLRLFGLEPVFEAELGEEEREPKAQPVAPPAPKAGRNDPCPCGSGKKYKKCHGK
ncbi:MAG TPA: SEC-C metal-binding domain-containing protein [Bryobacteraceae bacterium]|nr:SEC-C metal-binding domain-containing protein [Bryobacteraceae bacterium]